MVIPDGGTEMRRYSVKGLEEIFPGEQGPVLLTSPQAIFYTTGFYTTARRPNQIGNQCVLMDEQFTLFFCPRNWGDVIQRCGSNCRRRACGMLPPGFIGPG